MYICLVDWTALNLSTLDPDNLIIVQKVSLMGGVGGLHDLQSFFVTILVFDLGWTGLGLGCLGSKGLGPGLDNLTSLTNLCRR